VASASLAVVVTLPARVRVPLLPMLTVPPVIVRPAMVVTQLLFWSSSPSA
jgi:hypothetical protein